MYKVLCSYITYDNINQYIQVGHMVNKTKQNKPGLYVTVYELQNKSSLLLIYIILFMRTSFKVP